MTDQQLNAAIAEACGWKEVRVNGNAGIYKGFDNGAELRPDIPDYCSDLNAMHEAEKFIYKHNNMWNAYYYAIGAGPFSLHATARKKAEAFLRAIGKWEGK